jgi:hypothetical protein
MPQETLEPREWPSCRPRAYQDCPTYCRKTGDKVMKCNRWAFLRAQFYLISTVIQRRHPSYPSIDANENTELETNLRDLISYKILPSTLASRVVTHGSSVSPIASCHLTRQCHFAVAASSSNPHHPDLLSCSFIGGGGVPH